MFVLVSNRILLSFVYDIYVENVLGFYYLFIKINLKWLEFNNVFGIYNFFDVVY